MKHLSIFLICMLSLLAEQITAQSAQLSIQGIVKTIEGNAIENGDYDLTFKLYDVAIAGTILWEETIPDVAVRGGVYSVILGAGSTQLDVPFDVPYFLGVSVDGDIDLYPRARLTSSPYALSLIGDDNIFPNSGNVGVGSDAPQSKLTVQRGDGILGLEAIEDANNTATITTKSDGLEFSTEGATNAYYFAGEMTEVMRIKKDGKVGIGTDDPQNTLHIVGDNEQVKVEGTDNANIVFTKTSGSATLGFDAASGDTMLLSNSIGATKIEGNDISLNTLNGTAAIDGTVEVTKEGEALQLLGTTNTQLAFYPQGLAAGKKAKVSVEPNGQLLINSTNSDIILTPGTGNQTRANGLFFANGYMLANIPQANHIHERYTSSSYAIRRNSTNYNLSIYATHGVRAHEFVIASDRRIKKDFSPSDGQEDLLTLSKIEVTDYRHIDEPAQGSAIKKGVIAQQVQTVYPEAIKKGTDFIPNVFETPLALSLENGSLKVRLSKNHNFEIGDKVRVGTTTEDQELIVSSIISPQEFSVDNWEGSDNKEELFIYGKEVNDFNIVDYDRIFTLNVSATQELARQVEALKKENAALKTKATQSIKVNQELKAELETLSERMIRLESRFEN